MATKTFSSLSHQDLLKHPVWEFLTDSDETGSLLIKSIDRLPVRNLNNRIVAVNFDLADGGKRFGFLGNVHLQNKAANLHFITPAFETDSGWFTLSRYFDTDVARNGPEKLSQLLGRELYAIFPIKYDISPWAVGDPEVIRGEIRAAPIERLSSAEIAKLAVP